MKNRTCFVIRHRLSTIRDADLILVCAMADISSKAPTWNCCGEWLLCRLYNSQFERPSLVEYPIDVPAFVPAS